ncbi:hypothetical protein AB0K15_46305 [Amycolatopsis sp. NPDC049253]|uniref:Imm32 family immunity protein n=1 Tax=Amycolatopsis sp. NPDC049253 TaxID=3155274 RepID=UPI00343BAC17
MESRIEFDQYVPGEGLKFRWDDGFALDVTIHGSEVLLRGNPAGLTSLARHLLTLAQESVHTGSHLHLTGGSELDGDADLVIERADL